MTYAIRVDDLSKRYRIGVRGGSGYRTLRESIVEAASAPWRRLLRPGRGPGGPGAGRAPGEFWALRDVSFEIEPGEVVGVVGRNGAGKSTLLKILSRITEPTSGRAEIRGRVGSLLEVGTGFHDELTGRENIFLNGAILGMSRREIARKFDEIVAFAEIGELLETPVKRYSSGMFVRLAFSVAAHLDPEILIVDEVLAVGDISFQRRCLGRIREVSRSGRTVLLVSHSMGSIESLCTKALLLERGRVAMAGGVQDVVHEYHRQVQALQNPGGVPISEMEGPQREVKFFRDAALLDESGRPTGYLPLGGRFRLRIDAEARRPVEDPTIEVGIDDALGQRLLSVLTPASRPFTRRIEGRCEMDCEVPVFPLAPGDYWVRLALTVNGYAVDAVDQALGFSVVDGEAFDEGRGFHRGVCVAPSEWSLARAAGAA